jgi:Xaa-Pro aminopeptidase
MSATSARGDRLAALVAERGLDLLLVTNLVNVRYLTGYAGTNGICLVGGSERIFATDFRYFERMKATIHDYDVRRAKEDLLGFVAEALVGLTGGGGGEALAVGFDDAHLNVRAHEKLSGLVSGRAELVPAGGLVEQLRAVKEAEEVELMREATALADDLYRWLTDEHGLAGHTERSIAVGLERRAVDAGADGLSFPPIIAAADNGALPHAEPRDVEIPKGTLVIVDLGCRLSGYCSDCTRTFATGKLDPEASECYALVREAQGAALAAVAPGVNVREVDAQARSRIDGAGRGAQFGHGTGHGVGLEVHEAPRLSTTGEGALVSGNVVTIEPGVYVPGRFGVRIEDLVVVTDDGREVLTSTPKELITVGS